MKKAVALAVIVIVSVAPCRGADTVRASAFGFNATNATAALQAAINSGARTVVVDAGQGDWMIAPIKLRSNLEIVFEENVRVRAVPGAFGGRYEMMFTGRGVTNVTLRGKAGASLEMFKKDYLDARRYIWSEWRHMLAFYDSAGITVENLSLSSSGGDGVYIARCGNVRLENLLCAGHNRQGISVIAAENMLVRRCRFCFTEGTPPQCGIDFEPNAGKEYFVSNVIEQCEFDGNFSSGASFHIPHLSSASRPVSILFRNCRFNGNGQRGMGVYATWNPAHSVRGHIDFENCTFAGNVNGGISLSAMPPQGFAVNFRNCLVDGRGCKTSPISFNNGSSPFDFGGASFSNVTVLADSADVVSFYGMTGVGVTNVFGNVSIVTPDGRTSDLSLASFAAAHKPDPSAGAFRAASMRLQNLSTRSPDARPKPDPVFCRGRQLFVQEVPRAGKWTFRFLTRQVTSGNGGHPVEVVVEIRDRVGTLVDSFTVKEPEREYVLESARDNIYLFTVNSRMNECAVQSPYPGHGIRTDSRLRIYPGDGRKLWFVVPAASKKVAFELMAAPTRPLTVRVLDGAGRVRATLDKACEGHIVNIDRKPTVENEVWLLEVLECGDNGFFDVRMGGNVVAVLSDSPEACLENVKKTAKKK